MRRIFHGAMYYCRVTDVVYDVVVPWTLSHQKAYVEGSLVEHRMWIAIERSQYKYFVS